MTATSTLTTAVEATRLTDQQSTSLRALLVAEQVAEVAQMLEHAATVRDLTGQTDVDSILEREVAEAAVRRSAEAITDIDHALARLTVGTYGSCEQCGSLIAFERLEAIPPARLCVRCPGSRAGLLG